MWIIAKYENFVDKVLMFLYLWYFKAIFNKYSSSHLSRPGIVRGSKPSEE